MVIVILFSMLCFFRKNSIVPVDAIALVIQFAAQTNRERTKLALLNLVVAHWPLRLVAVQQATR